MLTVQVWDRSLVGAVEKAIRDSGLGLNPAVGRPAGARADPAADHRAAHRTGEDRRTNMPRAPGSRCAAVRRDGMEQIKTHEKKHEIGEDDGEGLADEVQKLTDQYIKRVDDELGRQGKGHPAGLSQRRCPARLSAEQARTGDRRTVRRARPMSRSSWTATAAGPPRAACRGSPAIARAPARCGAPSRRRSDTACRWLTHLCLQQRELAPPGGRGARPDRPAAPLPAERDRRTEGERRAAARHRRPQRGSTPTSRRDLAGAERDTAATRG